MAIGAGISRRGLTKASLGAAAASLVPFSTNAAQSFDYIIVGAGSAGCVLAARLSEKPGTSVLLLEAGNTVTDRSLDDPTNWFKLMGSEWVWPTVTAPQQHADNKSLFAVHGKLVGGSSAINAMIHHHPMAFDINTWGLDQWRYADIQQGLMRSEHFISEPTDRLGDQRGTYRGQRGPVAVIKIPDPPPLAKATLSACDQLGIGTSDDINGSEQLGGALNQLAFDGSYRQHTGRAYLRDALDRDNLSLVTGAQVNQLLFDGRRCVGVAYQQNGQMQSAHGAHVVLCAGALRTPALMMLSGLGPADHLASLGIATRADLVGVGANLHDHLLISGNNYATPKPVQASRVHGSVAVVYGQSNPEGGPRDLLLNVSTSGGVFPPLASPTDGFKSSFSFTRPKSRGQVTLKSTNPQDPPQVDHQILSHPDDLKGTLAALDLSRRVFSAKAFESFSATEMNSELLSDQAAMRQLIIAGATSFGHHCGTCRMGDDEQAVVSQALSVRGVSGLSVVDASLIPAIPSCPTNPLVMAMAEVAAQRWNHL